MVAFTCASVLQINSYAVQGFCKCCQQLLCCGPISAHHVQCLGDRLHWINSSDLRDWSHQILHSCMRPFPTPKLLHVLRSDNALDHSVINHRKALLSGTQHMCINKSLEIELSFRPPDNHAPSSGNPGIMKSRADSAVCGFQGPSVSFLLPSFQQLPRVIRLRVRPRLGIAILDNSS
jgi:hypothetical protein